MSDSGDWKKNMYQDRRSWSYEKKAWATVAGGGTDAATTRRQRSRPADFDIHASPQILTLHGEFGARSASIEILDPQYPAADIVRHNRDRRAVRFVIELTADQQDRIPQRLGLQPPPVRPPQPHVLWIDRMARGNVPAAEGECAA